MANTLSEVYEKVYDLMGEKTTSTTYTVQSAVSLINTYIDRICKGQVISLLDPNKRLRAGNLSFLEKKIYYNNIGNTSTSVETANGCTDITAVTTNFASAGFGLINGEVFEYTGVTGSLFTGITGISTNHKVGSLIYQIYELPSNITKPFQCYDVYGNEIEYQDFRFNDKSKYFTVITQDGVDYIYFNNCPYGNIIMKYYAKPTKLVYDTDDDTEIILPDDYGLIVVAPLVAGDMKFTKGEEIDLAQNNLINGYTALQEMYDYYSKKAVKYRQGINLTQPGDNNTIGYNSKWLYDDDKRF